MPGDALPKHGASSCSNDCSVFHTGPVTSRNLTPLEQSLIKCIQLSAQEVSHLPEHVLSVTPIPESKIIGLVQRFRFGNEHRQKWLVSSVSHRGDEHAATVYQDVFLFLKNLCKHFPRGAAVFLQALIEYLFQTRIVPFIASR